MVQIQGISTWAEYQELYDLRYYLGMHLNHQYKTELVDPQVWS